MTRIEGPRDEEAVRRFVEQFALSFSEVGVPRMAARVLGALMVADEPGLTAGEIAERLGVSAAAISGALRYLLHVNLVLREPVPNSRRDRYHAPDDIWYTAAVQSGVYRKLGDMMHQGVLAVGDDSPAGIRLADMRDFLFFVQDEMGALIDRWNETRQEKRPERAG
ncbi:GbsR/MarR family transcriptional regulator [Plantactinospora endophytica]|uniref:Transcriptional regulator n=1 Tax=Plantactinospora endophytica TaxID=673535 RepID=A0ABQ4ECN8_9ACTN|nr:MarR family transcriptional regulator [Plantactinospora endophytica]GIG92498.1 transcriptional regulator [Plantactinospora endophytica]